MVVLSKASKPDNFELRNSQFALQIFEAFVRILLIANLSSGILALCETNLDD